MMGDSDEDHDNRGGGARRGRDKFRRERSDFNGDRQGRRGDGWSGRRPPTDGGRELGTQQPGQWDQRRKRDYSDRRGGDRPGPRGDSPPMKRRRRDWDAGGGGYGGGDFGGGPYGMGGAGGQWGGPDMGMGPDRRGVGAGGMSGQGMGAMGGSASGGSGAGGAGEDDEGVYQQPMMSFKQWLAAQTDDIGEEEAVERYNTYKIDYKRTTINKFFDSHKEEEWFKEKYHPVVKSRREKVVRQQLRTRVNAFVDLMRSGRLDSISLDADNVDGIVKLLDAAMIKMEGGDDNDLRILDRPATPARERQKSKSSPSRSPERKKAAKKGDVKGVKKEATAEPPSPSSVPMPSEPPPARKEELEAAAQEAAEKAAKEKQREEFLKKQEAFQQQQKEQFAQMAEQMAAEQAKAKKEKRKHRRHHRDAYSYDTDESESEEDSEDDAADEPAPPGVEPGVPGMEGAAPAADDDGPPGVKAEPGVPGIDTAQTAPGQESSADAAAEPAPAAAAEPMDTVEQSAPAATDTDAAAPSNDPESADNVAAGGEKKVEQSGDEGVCDMEDGEDEAAPEEARQGEGATVPVENLPDPRPLHQTRSLHIRNLPPSVTRDELITIGKKTQGFLRAAIGDPNPEKKFQRRAWLTYEKNVNINEAHWSINTMKLKDHELNVITNRDVTNRVRNVSHLNLARQSVTADIQVATKLIRHLDVKRRIFEVEPEPEQVTADDAPADGEADADAVAEPKVEVVQLSVTSNPLLDSSEATVPSTGDSSASTATATATTTVAAASDGEAGVSDEEDGAVREEKPTQPQATGGGIFKRDDKQLKVLDRLLLYLRLVHSLDYYQAADMADEHEMPHKCCVIHVRGPVSATFKASLKDVTEYIKVHEERMSVFLKARAEVTADEGRQLGLKSIDEAVDTFVLENCKEVGKDKFLCPLSGKKFRGPEFVRKHIFNKHAEAVQAVRDGVNFFNSFLRDPERPHVPISSSAGPAARGRQSARGHGPMGPGPQHPGMQQGPNPNFDYPPEGMYGPPGFMGGGWGPRPHVMGYNPPFMPGMFGPFGGPPMEMFGRPPFPGPGGPRGRGRRDRRLMDYRDLDQPEDVDF